MTERRFNEAEVSAIFERATEAQQRGVQQSSSADGMTLAELQAIGREAGISSESIALAADAIGRVKPAKPLKFLGLPLGVACTVPLDRTLSDEEWERFVVDLRETFNASGTERREGSLRQWTNGNLQALLEPAWTGYRIRLRTVKGDALGMLAGGLGMVGVSTALLIAAALRGALGDRGLLAAVGFLGVTGAGMFLSTALRLPRWARTRERQMAEVAARVGPVTKTLRG